MQDIAQIIGGSLGETAQYVDSATLVGSAASKTSRGGYSDVDLVVLVSDAYRIVEVETELSRFLLSAADLDVVSEWGVVTRSGRERRPLHLLVDPIWHYPTRSSLFRRSVAKYSPFVGNPLSRFAHEERSISELHSDWDGPVQLCERLKLRDFTSTKWVLSNTGPRLVRIPALYSEPVDQALYAALHSCRNVLRLGNEFEEFSDLALLPTQWALAQGVRCDLVARLVQAKQVRREGGAFDQPNQDELIDVAVDLLEQLVSSLPAFRR